MKITTIIQYCKDYADNTVTVKDNYNKLKKK